MVGEDTILPLKIAGVCVDEYGIRPYDLLFLIAIL